MPIDDSATGSAESPAGSGSPNPEQGDDGPKPSAKSYSEAEVQRLIADRAARERRAFERKLRELGAEDAATLKARADELEAKLGEAEAKVQRHREEQRKAQLTALLAKAKLIPEAIDLVLRELSERFKLDDDGHLIPVGDTSGASPESIIKRYVEAKPFLLQSTRTAPPSLSKPVEPMPSGGGTDEVFGTFKRPTAAEERALLRAYRGRG